MTTDGHRKNKQRQRMVIFSFGLLMLLLYVASKNSNLPSEWTGMGVEWHLQPQQRCQLQKHQSKIERN